MLLFPLNDFRCYSALCGGGFEALFEYLCSHDLESLPLGRVDVPGTAPDACFINVQQRQLVASEQQPLEVHRRYIDVHIPLGRETIGWSSLSSLHTPPTRPYDEEDDYALYEERAQNYLTLERGQVLVCMPDDAHAPLIGEGRLRKLVGKVEIIH